MTSYKEIKLWERVLTKRLLLQWLDDNNITDFEIRKHSLGWLVLYNLPKNT